MATKRKVPGKAASTDPARDAREGNIDAIFSLIYLDTEEADYQAYKWLLVAADYGHAEAAERAADVLECSSLRYDDDGASVAAVEWDLGVAYLAGDGVPVDFKRAKAYLDKSLEWYSTATLEGEPEVETILAGLDDAAKRILKAALSRSRSPFKAVIRRVHRLERLHQIQAPRVIVAGEVEQLREAVERLAASVQ